MRDFAELVGRVADLERRVFGMMRHGIVAQVDTGEGLVRLKLGESTAGGDLLGPWVPYAQHAGAIKAHIPPSVGQQMTVFAPTGDLRQAVALPMTWSEKNESPSKAGDENVVTYGNVTITMKDDLLQMRVGNSSLKITGSEVKIDSNGSSIVVNGDGVKVAGSRIDLN